MAQEAGEIKGVCGVAARGGGSAAARCGARMFTMFAVAMGVLIPSATSNSSDLRPSRNITETRSCWKGVHVGIDPSASAHDPKAVVRAALNAARWLTRESRLSCVNKDDHRRGGPLTQFAESFPGTPILIEDIAWDGAIIAQLMYEFVSIVLAFVSRWASILACHGGG